MAKRPFIPIPPPAPLPEPEVIDVPSLVKAYEEGEIDLICVLGPTASGKTRYAVQLAREISAEIISADSRQVYRGMTIGTGKDLEEYGEVPYHLIDIVDAGEKYDLYRYQHDFEMVFADIRGRGVIPVLCGGTGLYIQAVTHAFALRNVPADWELRRRLDEADDEYLLSEYERLKEIYNSDAQSDIQSRHRLIRALEVMYAEEKGLPDGSEVRSTEFYPKKTYYIGTLVDRETRNARIDARLDARLEAGLVDEVRGLLASGVGPEDLIYYGLEYKFVTQYILGLIDYDAMRLQLATAIHQFAKRQMTFFRGMEAKGDVIHWTLV
ncbi:MAG: tRNA (adenosine(37)-N6)-dimethylallyltransferase MiaA [Bacteroidales bacterium]|nr:tRNA (adenosine(37)-N6)-dimethylallyltransferase MiaA [Bacteroidales bacterium]